MPALKGVAASNRIDIAGKKFGKLTVLKYVVTSSGRRANWLCECECGKRKIICGKDLRSRHVQSCGCRMRFWTHGFSKHRFWNTYRYMMKRCYDKNHIAYSRYGGRGIRVCKLWLRNPKAFLDWCTKNYKDGCSVDRYPDKNGIYSPSNCRFATRKEQQRNMRSNVRIKYRGKVFIRIEFTKRFGNRLFNELRRTQCVQEQ